jgi:hypothetical protein
MGVRRGGALLASVLVSAVLLSAPTGCSVLGEDCDSYRQTQYIPSDSELVFERDGDSVQVIGDPLRTLTVIVTTSDGRYQQTPVDPHVEIVEGIDLGTTFGFEWVAPGEQAPGQVRPALRVSDCWEVVEAPSDVF